MRDRRTQGTMLLAIGGMGLFLGRSDLTLSYVRAGIRPLLLASGAVLVALGLAAVLGPRTRLGQVPARGHAGDEHAGGGSRIAWLLVLPLLVLILVAPPALGSYAAGQRQATAGSGGADDGPMPPLGQAVGGAVPMEMSEFYYRAVFDERHSLDGVRVRLLGFATPRHGGGAYLLARFAMFCCAADAEVVEVAVRGDTVPRPADQWLVIEGHLRASLATSGEDPDQTTATPELVAESVKPVPPPRDRYEHTLFGY